VVSHARSHNVVTQTARVDLQGLEGQGLLTRAQLKRGYAWTPAEGLTELLDPGSGSTGRHRRRPKRRLGPSEQPLAAGG
jgi:hypothetical protein